MRAGNQEEERKRDKERERQEARKEGREAGDQETKRKKRTLIWSKTAGE
jgi:hypothetical protein